MIYNNKILNNKLLHAYVSTRAWVCGIFQNTNNISRFLVYQFGCTTWSVCWRLPSNTIAICGIRCCAF